MLKLFLFLRYLRKKRIVLLSIGAVALACALLIVVSSIFGGFIKGIEKATAEIYGDIYLDPGIVIDDHEDFIEYLERLPNVRAAAAVLETHGLLHLGRGDVKAVRICGIEPQSYSKVANLQDSLVLGQDSDDLPLFGNEQTGFVGIGLLAQPDPDTDVYDLDAVKQTWLDESVVLTTGSVTETSDDSSAPGIRTRYADFEISDISFTGIYFRDKQDVYLPFERVRELARSRPGTRGANERFHIALAPGTDPDTMLEPIQQAWHQFAVSRNLPDYQASHPYVSTAAQMTAMAINELQKQMAVLMLIFGVLSSAAILLIFCIFYMIVMTKRRDIGIIKSCGLSRFSVASIFLAFGLCLGVVGSALGVVLGTIVTHNINYVERAISSMLGFKIWRSSVYVFERIPNEVNISAAIWIVLFAIIAAVVGVLVPAVVAARTEAVDILRYE